MLSVCNRHLPLPFGMQIYHALSAVNSVNVEQIEDIVLVGADKGSGEFFFNDLKMVGNKTVFVVEKIGRISS